MDIRLNSHLSEPIFNYNKQYGKTKNVDVPQIKTPEREKINLQDLVISADEIKRFLFIMLPGKVVMKDAKGQFVDNYF